MRIDHILAKKLNYDPYEENVTGAHKGETINITFNGGDVIVISESRSGLGDTIKISIKQRHDGPLVRIVSGLGTDDDGELHWKAEPDRPYEI